MLFEGGCWIEVDAVVAGVGGSFAGLFSVGGVSEANLSLRPSFFQAGTRAAAVSAMLKELNATKVLVSHACEKL